MGLLDIFSHNYPYTDFHELNLDWVIKRVIELDENLKNFINLNTIKYANPILWDITRQYEANTVVIDGSTGNAYISVKSVPSGVHINRTEYWTQIYNYQHAIEVLREQIAYDEGDTTTATRSFAVDTLVFVQGLLYRVISPMIAGDSFVVGSNIEKVDIELLLNQERLARQQSDTQLQTAINDEVNARQNADNHVSEQIDELSSHVGDISALETDIKDNIVNAINELNNDIDNFESDLMHYVYVENYLVDNVTPTQALKQAIADCPSKGTVIIPRTQSLAITETIVIDKPITIKGLSGGVCQLEGGNNNTPNSEYIKYDIRFTGGTIGFNILSPSVHIEDLVIEFNVNNDFTVFNLSSQTGDNLNMPRDIKLKNIYCRNLDMSYAHITRGVYSTQTVILSTFINVVFGWVTYGFDFENANINTSLRFYNCNVTCKECGYFINHGQYCHFIGCSCESPSPFGFSFVSCTALTLLACFCEQITNTNFNFSACTGVNIIGCFSTSGILIGCSLTSGSIIGCYSTRPATIDNLVLNLYGSYMRLIGMSDCFISTDNGKTKQRIGYSDRVVKYVSTGTTEFTASGCTIASGVWDITDTTIHLALELNATATSGTITMPAYMLPLCKKTVPLIPGGWATLNYMSNQIVLNFGSTGSFRLCLEFDSMATQ